MNDLVTLEPGQLFQTHKPVGLEGMSERELGIDLSRLRIVHSIRSRNDIGRPGQLRLNTELFDRVEAVLLRGHHYRTLVEPPDSDKGRTVCASSNGTVPHDGVAEPRSADCRACAYGQWKDGAGDKRVPPPCQDGIALLVLILNAQPVEGLPPARPAWMLCSKSSRQKAVDLGRQMTARGIATLADYAVSITTEEKKNKGVVWYEPIFTIGDRLQGYSKIAQYVAEEGIIYTPPVFAGGVPGEVPEAEAEAAPWDVPV